MSVVYSNNERGLPNPSSCLAIYLLQQSQKEKVANMTKEFEGKVALITGGAMGMGFATAALFAKKGASVALADKDIVAAKAAADALNQQGYNAIAIACDVADEEQASAMVAETVKQFGRLDAAYNNAGIQCPMNETADVPAVDFDRTIRVNLRGVWTAMKHELRVMRAQGSGAIVNCSSLGGLVGLPDRAAYHASKFGVIGLTKSAALEYAARNIRINAVCPGIIETPMVADMLETQTDALEALIKLQPIGRLGRAEEVAAAVVWLCSAEASFIIGHALAVDGGYTVP